MLIDPSSLLYFFFTSNAPVTLQSTRISIHPRTIVRVVPASSRLAQGTAHLQTTHLLLGIQRRKREGEGDHQLHLPLLPPPRAAALVGPQEKHQEIARMVRDLLFPMLCDSISVAVYVK